VANFGSVGWPVPVPCHVDDFAMCYDTKTMSRLCGEL
jgi:hypothetical protein